MKVAPKLVFLFDDSQGFGTALYHALQPSLDSSLQRLDETFEISLEQYGIKGQKVCINIANFVDDKGQFQVSLLLVQYCEPPILACFINEIFKSIREDSLGSDLTLILPHVVPAAKFNCDVKTSSMNSNSSTLYGLCMGPKTELTDSMVRMTEKLPSLLQIHYEPLACLLQFVGCLKLPTALLIGKGGMKEEDEVVCDLGELLSGALGLSLDESKIKLNMRDAPKREVPWRALYG